MQSKLKLLTAVTVFAVGSFFIKASAQGVSVYTPQYDYNGSYLNYMMGIVSLPVNGQNNNVTNPIPTDIPTNVVPVSTVNNNVCQPLITSYNKFGSMNNDVAKLQVFLNQNNGANLNGKGFFGPATMREVKNLQYAYGINPTGAQYEKTTALINAINCGTVAKKPRVVYVSMNTGNVSVSTKNYTPENVYPNPGQTAPTPVKAVPTPVKTVNQQPMVGKPTTSTSSTGTKTDTLTTGFEDDFQKVKDNYKAYVLVFVLVLALFWFLRKAATE